MRSYKEKQFLVFELDDKKTVKYNLATGESIGKSGKVVKDVKTQLRGLDLLDVIDSFEDEKYRRFLKFVDEQVNKSTARGYYSYRGRIDKVRNIGTFLQRINSFNEYEQLFSADIRLIEYPLKYEFNQIPKGLLKLVRKYNMKLTNGLIASYLDNADMINLLINHDYISITKLDVVRLIGYTTGRQWVSEKQRYENFTGHRIGTYNYKFMNLIKEYNYKPLSLLKHIDNLITYEALNNMENVILEFYDYVFMMSSITNKFDKYPKNFLTTHKIASRNYSRMKVEFNEEIFKKRRDETLEFKYKNYVILYPNTTQDIKDEGCNLNHCVSSYINNVIDGKCHILFLRHEDDIDKNLVTLEVRDNQVVQARGKFNREVNKYEQEVINNYNKKLKKEILLYAS